MMTAFQKIRTLPFLVMLALGIGSAHAGTDFTWNGSVDANWSSSGNWTPAGPLTAGSNLIFPAGAGNLSNNNDLAAGTAFNTISITGNGYTLSGSNILLNTGLSFTNGGTANYNLATKASSASLAITVDANSTLNIGATIDANASAITASVGIGGLLNFAAGGGLTTTGANGYFFSVNGAGSFSAAPGSTINFPSGTFATNTLTLNTPNVALQGAVTATAANAGSVSIPNLSGTATINPTTSTGIAALNISGNGTTNIGGALTSLTASSSILTPTTNITANITHTPPSTVPVAGAGTISPNFTTTVTGTGTSFLTAVSPGDVLVAAGVQYAIVAVTSNTTLITSNTVAFGTNIGYSVIKIGAIAIQGIGTITTNFSTATAGNGTSFNTQLLINDFVVVNGVQYQVNGIYGPASFGTTLQIPPFANVPYSILRPNALTLSALNLTQAGGTTITAGNLNINVNSPLQSFPAYTPPNNATLAGTIQGNPAIAGAATITSVAGGQTVTAAATAFSTVPNGQWASAGDTIVVTFQGITQAQLITAVISGTAVSVAAPFNPPITTATPFTVLRGAAVFSGSGVIEQSGALGNGSGVTNGFGNVNILMSSASGVYIARGTNTLASPTILNSGFILMSSNSAFGSGEIVYNGGMLQAYQNPVTIPNYFVFNYAVPISGAGNIGNNTGANNVVFPGSSPGTAFTTQIQIGDSITAAGATNFVTGIKNDNTLLVAGLTQANNNTTYTINRSLVIGPTPNSFGALGNFGNAFDLTFTGTTTMNNLARTIIVNSSSPNGLIFNNPTQIPTLTAGTTYAISNVAETGNMATITTSAAHAFIVGQMATIFNCSVPGYNGNYVVTSVPTTTTFTCNNPVSGLASDAASGSASVAITEGNLLCGSTLSNSGRTLTKSGPGQLTISGGGTGWGLGNGVTGLLSVIGGTVVCNNNGILGPGNAVPTILAINPQATDVRMESNCSVILDYSAAPQIVGQGTVSSAGTTVNGATTVFANQFVLGDMIVAAGQTQTVVTITNATTLTTLNAFNPALSANTPFTIIRNKASLRDSYGLNGQNAMLQIKGASTANTLTTMANFVNGNGMGIVKLSNAAASVAGTGDTNLIVRTNMYGNTGINAGVTNFNVLSLFTSNPATTNNASSPLSFVRDSSSGGGGATLFQVNFGPVPADNMPIPWMKITTQTGVPVTTLIDQPAKYSGPAVTKLGFVPLTSGTVYTSLASGDWSNAATWTPPGIPAGSDQAIVNANHVIDLKSGAQAVATLTFNQSGSIVSSTGPATLQINSLVQTLYAYANPSIDANVNIVLGNSVQFDTLNFGALTINGTLSGAFALIKTGIGELKLPNGGSTYSGGTILGSSSQNLCGGTLTLGADTTPPTSGPVTAGPIGTGPLTWSSPQFGVSYPETTLQGSGTGTVRQIANNMLTGSSIANDILTIGGTKDFVFSGNLTLANSAILLIQNTRTVFAAPGIIQGNFALQKVGNGTLALSGQNTFSGGFTLGDNAAGGGGFGTLELLTDSTSSNPPTTGPLGTGTFTMAQWNTGGAGAGGTPLNLSTPSIFSSGTGARMVTNTLALNGNFIVTGNDLILGFPSASAPLSGTRAITINNTNTTINGSITGAGFGLIKEGTGTLFLPGNNTYSGATVVNNGILSVHTDTGRLQATSSITVNAGSTFDISGGLGNTPVDHIFDAASLNLNGGTFQIVPPATTSVSQTETLGQINVFAASTIKLVGSAIATAATNLQLTSNSAAGTFNFNGGTLNFQRVQPTGSGKTNLFLAPAPAARFDVPLASVNGLFAEYDVSGPNGLQIKTSTGSFISQTSASNNWSDTNTWVGGVIPAASDNVIIRSAVIANSAAQACNSVSFDQSGGSISGTAANVLTVSSGVINSGTGTSAATPSISCALNFGAVSGFINQNSPNAMTISGPITATSTAGITVGGSGTTNLSGTLSFSGGLRVVGGNTVLSGTNTYTGGSIVSGGLLNISADNNLGAVSGPVTIQGAVPATQPNGPAQSMTPAFPTVSGTITTAGTTAVIGSGTFFTQQLQVGDTIVVGPPSPTVGAAVVASIADDTHLTTGSALPALSGVSCTAVHGAGVIGLGTISPAASFTGYGASATTNGSNVVKGTGTNFLSQLIPGDVVTIGAQVLTVSNVTGPTSFTTTASASATVAASSYTVARSNLYAGNNTLFSGAGIGTMTTAPSTTVTGFGTSFTTQLKPGQVVNCNGSIFTVASITNDTTLVSVANPTSVQTQQAFTFGPGNANIGVGDQIIANGQIQTINCIANPYFLSTINTITGLAAGTPYLIVRPQGATVQPATATITGLSMTNSFIGTGNLNCASGSATVNQGNTATNFLNQLIPGDIVSVGGNMIVVQSIVSASQFIATAPVGFTTTNIIYQIQRPNVIGVNTNFTRTVNVGDFIYAGGQTQQIAAILDDTHLTTTLGFNPPLPQGTSFTTVRTINAQGTISASNSTAVTGTGTNFLSQVAVGDYIYVGSANYLMVSAIADDTHLTVAGANFNITNSPYLILRGSALGGGTLAITSNDVLLNPARGFIIGPQGGSVFIGANLTFTVNSALVGNHPLNQNGPGRFTLANGNIVAASTSQRQACTFINQGQLRFGTANALGALQNNVGTIIASTGLAFVMSGATLEVAPTISTGNSQQVFFANGSTLAGFGNCIANFGGSVIPASGAISITHQLLNPGDSFTTNAGSSGNAALSANGANPDNVIVNLYANNGRIIFNPGAGYDGVSYAQSGIVQSGSFGDNNPQPSTLYVMPGATLALSTNITTPVVMMGGTLGATGANPFINGPNGNPGNGALSTANIPMLTIAVPSTITTDDVVNPGTARTLTINGIVAGTAPINILATLPGGAVALSSPNNTYSGTVTVNSYAQLNALGAGSLGQASNPATVQLKGGTLEVANNMGINFPANVVVATSDLPGVFSQIQVQDNGTLFQNQIINLSSLTMGSQNLVVIGRNYQGQYNYQLGFGSATFTGTPTFNSLSAILRFDSPIGGNNGLIKCGPMPLQLNAANTYTGATTINAGPLILNGTDSKISGDVVVNTSGEFIVSSNVINSDSIADGASVKLNGGSFTLQAAPNITHTEAIANLTLGTGTSVLNLLPNGTGDAQLSLSGSLTANAGANLTFNRTFTAGTNNANLLLTSPSTDYFDVTVVEPTATGRGVYHSNPQPDLGVVAFQGSGTPGTGPFVYRSVASGNWDDASKWVSTPAGGPYPHIGDDAIINAGHTMDLHGANQAANSVTFASNMAPFGPITSTATSIGTSNTAYSGMLTNMSSPVGRKLTVQTNLGLAQNNTSTVTFFNAATGMIALDPPLANGFINNQDAFRLDLQVTGSILNNGFTAQCLSPYGGPSSPLIGQNLIFLSGNAMGQSSSITAVSTAGVVTFASNMAIAPAAGDTFIIGVSVVAGAVTTVGGTNNFTAAALAANGGSFSNYLGCQIIFTSGANSGYTAQITQVNANGLLTYAPASTNALVGDTFIILANQNNGITNVNGNNTAAVAQNVALTVDSGVVTVLQPTGSSGLGLGWKGEYYNGANFTNLTMTRIDPNISAPNITVDPDGIGPLSTTNFSVVWSGFLIPDYSEDYTFTFRQDDAARVYINGQLVVDGWNLGAVQTVPPYGTIYLSAGVKYPVRVEYANVTAPASYELQWNSANQTAGVNVVIPTTNVIPANSNTYIGCALQFASKAGKVSNNGGGTLVINGFIQGTNGLQVEANGTIALNGPNTYTGGTTLGSGFIQLGNSSALGGGSVTVGRNVTLMGALQQSNLSMTIPNTINAADDFYIGNSPNQLTFSGQILMLNGNRIITFNNAVTRNTASASGSVVNITGTISDGDNGYSFIKSGSGNVQFSSQLTQMYNAPTIIARGQILLGIDNALNPASSVILAGTGTGNPNTTNNNNSLSAILNLNGFNQTTTSLIMGFNPVISQQGIAANSIVTSGFGGTGGGNLIVNNASLVRYDGAIQGSLNLIKNGTGTFVLGGGTNNTYHGQTIINQGTLAYGSTNAIPCGANGNASSTVIVNANGTLDLNGTSSQLGRQFGAGGNINGIGAGASLQINNGAIINSAPSGFLLLACDVYATGTQGHIDGQLQFVNNWTEQMFVNYASDVLTINAALNSNTAGNTTAIISKMGAGKVLLNGSENQYAGSIIVNQGTFQLNGATAALINCVGLQLNGGTFLIDNTNGGSSLNHLSDQMAMTFNGGAFSMQAPSGSARNETVGTINFSGGNSTITLTPNGTSSSILTASAFARSNGATFTLDRSNASGVPGADGGHLFFTTPAPLSDGGAVPFGQVTNTTASPTALTNVQAIYTTAQGVIEGTPPGTLYITNGTGGGNWSSGASWQGGLAPANATGDRVRIIGNDTITLTSATNATSVDQIEFANNGATPSNGIVTGGFNLTINSASTSLNQILVSGTGAPTISTAGLVVGGSFLINNLSPSATGLTISAAISNSATSADLPLVWYKFDEGTLGSTGITTAINSGSLGAAANGNLFAGAPPAAATISISTETAGNIATITTTAAHNLVIGEQITISGNSVAAFNGTFFITTVPSATTFTFSNPTANTTSGSGGTVQATSGIPSYVAGTVGTGALSFNGGVVTGASSVVNGAQGAGFVDAPGFSLPAGSPITVSFWFQIPNTFAQSAAAPSTAMRQQFTFGVGANQATNGQALNRFSCNTPSADGYTYFDYGGQTSFQDRVQFPTTTSATVLATNVNNLYVPNTWIHCVMVAGGSTSPYRAIYMNGTPYSYHYFGSAGPQVTLERLIIGCSPENLGFNMYQGLVDDFRIYNRVLGPSEIATLFAKNDPVNASITKTGPGTVILGGANTFTSTLNIDAGVVSVSSIANLNSAVASPPQIGLNGGTLLATANITTPLKQQFAINAPSPTTSVDAANNVLLTIQGPMAGGSMGVNNLSTSTGTVFIQSNQFIGAGTVSVPAASTAVTGTGTSFVADVKIGDQFCAGGFTQNVVAIGSATALTLGGSLGLQSVTAGNSYTIVRPLARTGKTFVNHGTLRLPTCASPQATGSTVGSSQVVVNSGATLDIFTNTIAGAGTIACTQNATGVAGTGTTFGTDVAIGDTIAVLDNNGNPATAIVSAITNSTTLTLAAAFNNTAPVTNKIFQIVKGPAGYFFNSPIFLNDGATLQGTGNMATANLGSGAGGGINSIVTVAQNASVTIKTRDATNTSISAPAMTDVLSMSNATDQLRGGGGLVSITGTGTLASSGIAVTGSLTSFTTQAKLGDSLSAGGQTRMIININSDTSVNVASPFSPALASASFTLLRTSSIVYGGAGRVQYPNDNGSFLFLGNHIVNSSPVNNIVLSSPTGQAETGGPTGLATPTISSMLLMFGATNVFGAQQNTIIVNSGTIAATGGSLNCPLILNGGGISGSAGNNSNYNASINVASDSYFLSNCFNALNPSNLQCVGPLSGNGKLTLYAPVGTVGACNFYFQNPTNTYTGNVLANSPWISPTLQPTNPDNPATMALPCTFQLGYTPALSIRSDAPTRYSASVQLITGSASTQSAIASMTETINTVTVTTTSVHNLTSNSAFIIISGATPSQYNGTFQIASVPSSTTFTYMNPLAANLGAGSGGTVRLASARIDTGSLSATNNPFTQYLNNLTLGASQTLYLNSTNNQGAGFYGTTTLTAPVDPATPTFYNNGVVSAFAPTPIELAGPVVDGGNGYGFVTYGIGMLILGSANNSYGGDTKILQGTLQMGVANAIPFGTGKGNLVLGGTYLGASLLGTLDMNRFNVNLNGLAGSGTVDNLTSYGISQATPMVLTIGNANATGTVFAGIIQNTVGSIKLVKTGMGSMQVIGNNTYTGTTQINKGSLLDGGTMGTAVVSIAAGATLKSVLALTIPSLTGSGTLDLTASGATIGGDNTTTSVFTGPIVGTGGFGITKVGTGTQTLSGTATFNGPTTISSGILKCGIANVLPFGTGLGDLTVTSPGQLDMNGFSQRINGLNGNGTLDSSAPGSMTLTLGNNHADGAFAGIIKNTSGTVSLVKTGNGLESFSGLSTYSGATTIGGGTLQLQSSPTTLPVATAVTISGGGTLDLAGVNQTIGSLSSTDASGSAITLGTGILTVGNASNTTYDGSISGTGAVIKKGIGALTMTGNSNYTGTTTINNGSIVLGTATPASSASIVSALRVNGNGVASPINNTTLFRGTGTAGAISAASSVAGDAVIWPGTSTVAFGPNSLSANETLSCASANLSSGGKLAVVLRSGGGPFSQKLVTASSVSIPASTVSGTSAVLSFTVDSLNNTNEYPVIDTGSVRGVSTSFGIVIGPPGATYGTDYDVVYRDTVSPNVDIQNPALGTVLAHPVNQVLIVAKNSAVTPVTVQGFAARPDGLGVYVSWHCISEYKNAGFNVYRHTIGDSTWNKVNAALIAGRVTSPDLKMYGVYDWVASGLYEYKLESISVAGVAEEYQCLTGPVKVEPYDLSLVAMSRESVDAAILSIDAAANAVRTRELGAKFERAGTVKPTNPGKIGNNHVAQDSGALTPANPALAARWFSNSIINSSTAFTGAKVTYKQVGVLLIPQTSLPGGLDLNHLAVQREGRSVPVLAVTPSGLLVFGQGYEDDYTNTDALFLRRTSGSTVAGQASRAQGLFTSAQTANVDAQASVTTNYHDVYFDYNNAFRPYTFAPWYSSQYLTADDNSGTTQTFGIDAPFASGNAASLTVNVWSLTQSATVAQDHTLQILINGQPAGQAIWGGGDKMVQLTFQVPSGVLVAGTNQIELVTPPIIGCSQIAFLHSMTLSYTRLLDGSKPVSIYNAGASDKLFEVSNLPGADAWVVDARFPDRAALLPYEAQAAGDGTYKVRFNAGVGGTGQYLVVPAGMENAPLAVCRRQIKPLKSSGVYLSTGPSQFGAGIQSLLMQRSKEGLRGQFVDQEQLFDYFNYGRYGPSGIQKAVQATRPQYLLLLGRTTYDYKNYSGENVDPLCPAFLVSTTFWAQATSDSTFGDLGRGYPEVAVGRLPVNNARELSVAVRHILSYSGAPASGARVHAVADRADDMVADFPAQTNALNQSFPDMAWQPNYLGVTHPTSPEVTGALTAAANGGADWILYVGHGNAMRLGKDDPRILDTDSVQAWTGNVVLLQSTCTANWMAKDVQDYRSIAIQAMVQPQGGISASIASSTYMNSDRAVEFIAQLMKNANSERGMRWGNALMKAQQWAHQKGGGFYSDLNKTEQIFGDPAMLVYSKTPPAAQNPAPSSTGGKTPATGTF